MLCFDEGLVGNHYRKALLGACPRISVGDRKLDGETRKKVWSGSIIRCLVIKIC
jgi:hypothetical protein